MARQVPVVLQSGVPLGHPQTLLVHTCPLGQDAVLPFAQLHCEFTHVEPVGQVVMQLPQWAASVLSV